MLGLKTPQELQISQEEYDALVWVKEQLRNKNLVHIDPDIEEPEGRNAFNMSLGCKTHNCGSVACVGGWAWVHMNLNRVQKDPEGFYRLDEWETNRAHDYVYYGRTAPLGQLYFPPSEYNYENITADEAATAIENFLKTGEPLWEDILGGA